LRDNLKFNLSLEKTKITNIEKEYAHFLGFRFRNNQRRAINLTYIRNGKRVRQRMVRGIFCSIDHERVLSRLIYKGIIERKGKFIKPRHKILYIPLKEFEIVDRFKSLIFGLFQYYYKHITFKSSLARYHYYISLSAFKTIAARKKSTVRKIQYLYTS